MPTLRTSRSCSDRSSRARRCPWTAPRSPIRVVTATLGKGAASGCLSGAVTTSVITDATGAFKLALDPGQYQFDYNPPAGSPAPRWTEDYEVKVDGGAERTVHLPAPALFEGDVKDALGQPLQSTTIRIFEPHTSMDGSVSPPTCIGQTQSDADGHFRAIVRAPPLAN